MEDIKSKLEAELTRIVERIRYMGGATTSVNTMNALGDTNQLADEVAVIQINEDREMNFATRSLLIERANRLAEALERLRGGEYGICQECDEAIAPARLKAMPEVTTCVRCQDHLEQMSPHLTLVGAAFDGGFDAGDAGDRRHDADVLAFGFEHRTLLDMKFEEAGDIGPPLRHQYRRIATDVQNPLSKVAAIGHP